MIESNSTKTHYVIGNRYTILKVLPESDYFLTIFSNLNLQSLNTYFKLFLFFGVGGVDYKNASSLFMRFRQIYDCGLNVILMNSCDPMKITRNQASQNYTDTHVQKIDDKLHVTKGTQLLLTPYAVPAELIIGLNSIDRCDNFVQRLFIVYKEIANC